MADVLIPGAGVAAWATPLSAAVEGIMRRDGETSLDEALANRLNRIIARYEERSSRVPAAHGPSPSSPALVATCPSAQADRE